MTSPIPRFETQDDVTARPHTIDLELMQHLVNRRGARPELPSLRPDMVAWLAGQGITDWSLHKAMPAIRPHPTMPGQKQGLLLLFMRFADENRAFETKMRWVGGIEPYPE